MSYRARQACSTLVVWTLLIAAPVAPATETDQFTTPMAPLYDLGPRLSRKVVAVIESDRTGRDPERILSEWAGHNVLASRASRWVRKIRVAEQPVQFRPRVPNSIYCAAISPTPGSFLFDSPTVNIHGYYVGTDKIDHFFQQGYEYFKVVMKHRGADTDDGHAMAAAVAHGVRQEHEYYGTLSTGIYSNGDLAANYAGMKFYLNLRHPTRIGEREWPPLFERSAGGWRLRPGIDRDRVLEPFFSNHLDESLNPSRYRFSRGSIRSRVRTRCEQWTLFYADRVDLVAPSGQSFAATWFGEEYGHWLPPADEISIATECAPAKGRSAPSSVQRSPADSHRKRMTSPAPDDTHGTNARHGHSLGALAARAQLAGGRMLEGTGRLGLIGKRLASGRRRGHAPQPRHADGGSAPNCQEAGDSTCEIL